MRRRAVFSDLTQVQFENGQLKSLLDHVSSIPIDHPDSCITSEKLAFGTWETVREVTIPENVNFVDFVGLDIKKGDFYILLSSFRAFPWTGRAYYLYVEGDYTFDNYAFQQIYAMGTTISATGGAGPPILYVGADQSGMAVTWITLCPKNKFRYISLSFQGIYYNEVWLFFGRRIPDLTNITQLRIDGPIGAGSKFLLGRVKSR